MKTSKKFVIDQLHQYINSEKIEAVKKKNPEFASALSNITENNIYYGNEPVLCFGTVYGNSTAVGTQGDAYNEITRTISLDFNSNTYIFVDKNTNTTASFVRKAQHILKKYQNYEVKYMIEAEEIAKKVGKQLCKRDLNDLNFQLSEYRLNRFELVEEDVITLPIREIKSEMFFENKKRTVTIGYIWENNGEEHVMIYFDNDSIPMMKKKKLIILGLGILAIIVLILIFKGIVNM